MDEVREAIPQSCKPCRKRKAKCDRAQPCLNCLKFGNECTYERIYRTPLTRRYLTKIETELAQAKKLLQRYESGVLPTPHAEQALRRIRTPQPQDENSREDEVQVQSTHEDAAENLPQQLESFVSGHHSQASTPDARVEETCTGRVLSLHSLEHRSRATASQKNVPHPNSCTTFSMETPPTGDFDWDERMKNNSQFTDGMAALTQRSSRGYMGVASGAALLRLADSDASTTAVEVEDANREATPTPALFSLAQLEHFVDAYFTTYHISYPIVHEASFRAQFMELIPRPGGNAWQVLLHVIATIGAFAAAETAPEVDLALFEAAKSRMSVDMLETGNLCLVQALALMSNYVQKRNKPNSGYNYLGLAKRVAMGIGLHKEFPTWHSRPLMLEIRRRVWYCLYIFDVGAIITFSRPMDLPKDGVEVQLPLNVSDGDITASTKQWPTESQCTTLYTHLRCQAQFHLATCGIYERLISSYPSSVEMLRLDQEHLETWLHKLPPFFSEQVTQAQRYRLCHSVLQWRWRNMRILMYRPYLIRHFMARIQDQDHATSSSDDMAIRKCLDTVADTIRLITAYWHNQKQDVMTCWYALYFLFQALLVPVICLRNGPFDEKANTFREQILDALSVISSMMRLNSAAERCYHTIMNLCGAFLGDGTPPNVTESPQTQLNALHSFMWPIIDPQLAGGYESFQETSAYDFMTGFENF